MGRDYLQCRAWCDALNNSKMRSKNLTEIPHFTDMAPWLKAFEKGTENYKKELGKVSHSWSYQKRNPKFIKDAGRIVAVEDQAIKEAEAAATVYIGFDDDEGNTTWMEAYDKLDEFGRIVFRPRVPSEEEWEERKEETGSKDDESESEVSEDESEEEEEEEVVHLRLELETVQYELEIAKAMLQENGLKEDFLGRLQEQQQEQQGRMPDDDACGEEEEEAPHIHFDDEANDVVDGGIGIGQEPKQKEPNQQQGQKQQQQQQQQPKLKERGLKKADANVVNNAADVEVGQEHDDDDRAKTRGGDGGGGRGDYANHEDDSDDGVRECPRAGGGINRGGDGASSAAKKRRQQQLQGKQQQQQPGHDNGDSADVGVQAGAAGAELVTQEQLDELRDEVFAKLDGKMNKDALKIIFAALNDRPSREDVFAALNTRATREELNQVEALLRRELGGKAEETEVSTALSYLGKQQVEQRMETTQEYKSVYSTMETNKMEVLAEVNEIVKRALSNRRSEDKDKLEDENNNLEDNEESNDEEEGEEEESSDEGN